MGGLGKDMYNLGVVKIPKNWRIVHQSDTGSPLGRVTLAGFIDGPECTGSGMRVLGSYALVYCLRGPCLYRDARSRQCELNRGDLLLVFPEIPHRYGPVPGQTWNQFFVVFSGPVFDLWRKTKLLDTSAIVHHVEPVDYWLRRFDDAVEKGTDSLQRVCALQHALADALVQPAGHSETVFLAKAKTLLEADAEVPLPEIARQVGLSYDVFRKRFADLTGMPPAQYRATQRILKACDLLVDGEPPLKDIAVQLGFCDEFHFSKRFKQITGLTPTQYRRVLPKSASAATAHRHSQNQPVPNPHLQSNGRLRV
jgi:AraC-like DNA-binding protein